MNSIVTNFFDVLHMTSALRDQMLGMLSDAELTFGLPGNPTLGELVREMGEVEQSYIDSFKTLKQDFSYRNNEPGIAGSVAKLSAWFRKLDAELDTVLAAFSEDEVQNKIVERGFQMPVIVQFHTYREALLIYYGKLSVYLKAMGKPLTEQWQGWIG